MYSSAYIFPIPHRNIPHFQFHSMDVIWIEADFEVLQI